MGRNNDETRDHAHIVDRVRPNLSNIEYLLSVNAINLVPPRTSLAGAVHSGLTLVPFANILPLPSQKGTAQRLWKTFAAQNMRKTFA